MPQWNRSSSPPGVVALAKMGDKIQITTVATVVRYAQPLLVVIGTIVGRSR
ncbi:TMEM165/GDT1 family protein [Castellaniella defragrans]|uniref:TMEM165/GDT1 family protein n=1 Tax=Castellaniella defragrans TaxID=75697 RepID=UPI003908BBC1